MLRAHVRVSSRGHTQRAYAPALPRSRLPPSPGTNPALVVHARGLPGRARPPARGLAGSSTGSSRGARLSAGEGAARVSLSLPSSPFVGSVLAPGPSQPTSQPTSQRGFPTSPAVLLLVIYMYCLSSNY